MINLKTVFKPAVTAERFQGLLRSNVRGAINETLRVARQIVRKRVKRASRSRESARLYETVNLDLAKVSTLSAELWTANPIWLFYDEPTKAHVIEPREKKALRFVSGGNTVFAKRVHHPGTSGHFYWREAADFVEQDLPRTIGLGVDAAVRGERFTMGEGPST